MKSPLARWNITWIAAVLAVSAPGVNAHPGHGLGEKGALHLLTSPDHLAVLALSGCGLWLISRLIQRQVPRRVLQGLSLAALATAAVLWGMGH